MALQTTKHTLLKTNSLTKKYKEYHAVDEVSMTINKGDIYGFIGKNGAGKTTFIRLITHLIEQSSGNLSFSSKTLSIGAVIEGPACYPYLSAKENLQYYAIQRNIKDKKRINEVLEFVGLSKVDPKKKFKDYSLGMRQRLGIGLAILEKPAFLILDEPTNGLDPQGIVEIREIIQRLNQEYDTTILISSHILSELSLVASRYGIIHEGKLVKELTKESLEAECSNVILLKSSDDLQTLEILKENKYQVEQTSDGLIVKEERSSMPTIGKILHLAGIYLREFHYKEENLEEYYLNLIGGTQ